MTTRIMMYRYTFLSTLILYACTSSGETTVMSGDDRVTGLLNDAIMRSDIPGIQYVVVDSQNTLINYSGGWADIASRDSMTPETPMMAYSMTKTLTAAAVLSLAEDGKLRLDDSVHRYLDNHPYGERVTIRQLLAHTAGIPNPIPLRWIHPADQPWHAEQEDSALNGVYREHPELDSAPGEKYIYTNIGYWMLGKIIEKASGMRYEEYMKRRILVPLRIDEKSLGFTGAGVRAKGYLARWSLINFVKRFVVDDWVIGEYEDNWLHIMSHNINGPAFGGAVGTARGVSIFLQDMLRSSSVILNDESKKMFFEQQSDNEGNPVEMTLGWHVGEMNGMRYFFKEGGGGGFHCEMRIYPDAGIATVMMVNETSAGMKRCLDEADTVMLDLHRRNTTE